MAKDEFDDIAAELKATGRHQPFIERPPHMDLQPGSMCWMDGARVCGADCTAFNAEEGLDVQGMALDTPNKCLILLYMGQQGSAALSIIAVNSKRKKAMEDAARAQVTSSPDPPDPRGPK